MALLEIDNFGYRYQAAVQPAMTGVSFSIDAGEFVGVIGSNNGGKSTLCYALSGIIPHLFPGEMTGDVALAGTELKQQTVSDIARKVGLVLQTPASQMSGIRYTVFEEVAFGLENRGVGRADIEKRVQEVLQRLGLEDVAARSPLHLSGGQQQRLALATVLAVDPAVLVLDEPTTFLDPQGTVRVFDILNQLRHAGKTIILAEQRLDLIAEFADRVIALDRGALVMDGSPREVLTSSIVEKMHLAPTRYTQVARILRRKGWGGERPLPASLSDAVEWLLQEGEPYDRRN